MPERVLTAYSLLSWKAIGMPPDCAQALARTLTDGQSRTSCPTFDALLQCGNRTALQCSECALLDQRKYGRCANYCAHCIDYVTRCFRHETLLESAAESSTLEGMLIHKTSEGARRNSLRYARSAIYLADACPHQQAWSVIAGLLQGKHFVCESGRWRIADLRREAQRYFQPGFEDPRLTHIAEQGDFLEAAIRSATRGRPVHPTSIAMLYMFATEAEALPVRGPSRSQSQPTCHVSEQSRATQRSAWLRAISHMEGLSRTRMRKRMSALWSWLYRNDRAWLTENQVAPARSCGGRKTPPLLPAGSAAIAENTADPRCSAQGRAPLPSAYQMRIAYGMRECAFNRLALALGGIGPTAAVPGWKEVFVAKRSKRASDQLAAEGKIPSGSVHARRANLRPATLARYLHH